MFEMLSMFDLEIITIGFSCNFLKYILVLFKQNFWIFFKLKRININQILFFKHLSICGLLLLHLGKNRNVMMKCKSFR